MKTIRLLESLAQILLCLPLFASEIKLRPEKGINITRAWNSFGQLISERKQVLHSPTRLYDQYISRQFDCCDWTQRVSRIWFEGERDDEYIPRSHGIIEEHMANGTVQTNLLGPDPGTLGVLESGCSQGAMVVVSMDGLRTQIVNSSTIRTGWETNSSFNYACPREDDIATVILWYHNGNTFQELPWFVASSVSLEPGQAKIINLGTPLDSIWRYRGMDKCFGCSDPCWLAGWPKPVAKEKPHTSITSYSGSLRLNFTGQSNVLYAIKSSKDFNVWRTDAIAPSDMSGRVQHSVTPSQAARFFKIEAVRTATMNENETALAVKDLQDFWK